MVSLEIIKSCTSLLQKSCFYIPFVWWSNDLYLIWKSISSFVAIANGGKKKRRELKIMQRNRSWHLEKDWQASDHIKASFYYKSLIQHFQNDRKTTQACFPFFYSSSSSSHSLSMHNILIIIIIHGHGIQESNKVSEETKKSSDERE